MHQCWKLGQNSPSFLFLVLLEISKAQGGNNQFSCEDAGERWLQEPGGRLLCTVGAPWGSSLTAPGLTVGW